MDRLKRHVPWIDGWSFTDETQRSAGSHAVVESNANTQQRTTLETVADASGGSSTTDQSADLDLTDVETSADLVLELGLTEPEFVMRFLEAHDGKVEQQAFVDQLDWSESKISRLLKSIEDDGRLVRLRKGRKKIVYTPERAPSGDPFAHLDDDRMAGSAGSISDAIPGEAVPK